MAITKVNGSVIQYRKNAIINGEMNVWQRGVSFAAAASGTYLADRWQWIKAGAGVTTISQSTDVPTVTEAGRLFNYSLAVAVTTADTSIDTSDAYYVRQRIEGYNWLPLAQRPIVLSFWVKSPVTGIHCVSLQNLGNGTQSDRSCIQTFTVNAVNTWEKKTVTFPASPSDGTWNYTNSVGVDVSFILAMGSTWHNASTASWLTGNYYSTSGQVNVLATIGNTYKITGVQLEAGSTATDFEYRSVQDELALCKRYYEVGLQVFQAVATAGSQDVTGQMCFSVEKRVTPTVTDLSVSYANCTNQGVSHSGLYGFGHTIRSSSVGQLSYSGNYAANAEL